ncbi:MAG: MFS transporter [Chloroflexi bacterium]|nr:MAG: MFS transporter [Chloroflexota bacterium]
MYSRLRACDQAARCLGAKDPQHGVVHAGAEGRIGHRSAVIADAMATAGGIVFDLAITTGDAIFILYATRVLGLDGALVGAVYTIGGRFRIRSVDGASRDDTVRHRPVDERVDLPCPGRLGARACCGRTTDPRGGMAGGADRARGVGAAVFNVTSSSVFQAAIPDRLQGRVGGAGQVLGLGLIPVAALAGGWLGGHVGLWNTLAISVGGQILGLVYVVSSPLRRIRTTEDLGLLPSAEVSGSSEARTVAGPFRRS